MAVVVRAQGNGDDYDPSLYNPSRFVIPRLISVNAHALTREQLFGKTAKIDWLTDVALEAAEEVLLYPLTFARKLISLGYEPFTLVYQPRFAIIGDCQFFLPNTFSYIWQFGQRFGFCELYNGIGTYGAGLIVHSLAYRNATQYIENHWPKLASEAKTNGELHVADTCVNARFRSVTRRYIATVAALCVSHPFNVKNRRFAVVLTRQVAKYIVREPCCYFFGELKFIGRTEGLDGLYAGFPAALLTSLVALTGVEVSRWLVEWIAKQFNKKTALEEKPVEGANFTNRKLAHAVGAQFIVWPALQMMVNATNLMMLGATDLATKLVPNATPFNNWADAYGYLRTNRLQYRGAFDFLRVHRGWTIKHLDGNYYVQRT